MSFLSHQDISLDIEDVIQLFKMILPTPYDRHLTPENFLDFTKGRFNNPSILDKNKSLKRSKVSMLLQKAKEKSNNQEESIDTGANTSDVRKSRGFERRN